MLPLNEKISANSNGGLLIKKVKLRVDERWCNRLVSRYGETAGTSSDDGIKVLPTGVQKKR
jgi:hypothetical protein